MGPLELRGLLSVAVVARRQAEAEPLGGLALGGLACVSLRQSALSAVLPPRTEPHACAPAPCEPGAGESQLLSAHLPAARAEIPPWATPVDLLSRCLFGERFSGRTFQVPYSSIRLERPQGRCDTPTPVPGRNGEFPVSRFGRIGKRGFPSPLPTKSGKTVTGSGKWGFGGLSASLSLPGQAQYPAPYGASSAGAPGTLR